MVEKTEEATGEKNMPAVNSNILVDKIIESIQLSGGNAVHISEKGKSHPRIFMVNNFDVNYSIWVYIWTLTHGGRVSLPNEFRIQMTSVSSPLPMNPKGITVLMGYHPDLQVFAGFDLTRHKTFTVGSPSVQIDISALQNALQNGLSFIKKDNDEIAVGIRPDQFLSYCINAEQLHIYGAETDLMSILNRAVELENINDEITTFNAERKRIISNIYKLSRNANFRCMVLNAYENRCAVTRMQLRLVDAAHILPVASEESNDLITNGIALSPTLHRAYDNCLIFLDEQYYVRLNEQKAEELISLHLDGGFNQLKSFINKKIHLPHDCNQRPNIEYIKKANMFRRIPGYY